MTPNVVGVGDLVCLDLFIDGHLNLRLPTRLVRSLQSETWLWLANGTPIWRADMPTGVHMRDIHPDDRPVGGFPIVADQIDGGNALIYHPEGKGYSAWCLFSEGLEFRGWYVNMELRHGNNQMIRVEDLDLDIVVHSNGEWQWKDKDSFERKIGDPAYWDANQAMDILRLAREVIGLVETNSSPFDGNCREFRPDPTWAIPPALGKPSPVYVEKDMWTGFDRSRPLTLGAPNDRPRPPEDR